MKLPSLRYWLSCVILFAAYFVTAAFGLRYAAYDHIATSVWPPSGIALAGLFILGYRFWPAVFLASFSIHLLVGAPVWGSFGAAVSASIETILAIALLRAVGFQKSMSRVRDIFALIVLAAGLSTAVGATIGVISMQWTGVIPSSLYRTVWTSWWTGNGVSDLVIAPLIFVASDFLERVSERRFGFKLDLVRLLEAIVLGAVIVVVGFLVLYSGPSIIDRSVFGRPYFLFPVVLWAAIRFRQAGAVTATLILWIIGIWALSAGQGPFVISNSIAENMLRLQAFIAVQAMTALFVASTVCELMTTKQTLELRGAQLATIVDSALDCIIMIDRFGFITEFNPAAEKVFGYSRAKAIGTEMASLVIPERLRERHREGIRNYLETGEDPIVGKRIEMPALRADGTEFPVELYIAKTTHEGLPAWSGYLRDITERKTAEAERARWQEEMEKQVQERTRALRESEQSLAASEERYRLMVNSISDYAIYRLDPRGRVMSWNLGGEKIKGYTADEIIGRNFAVFYPEEDLAKNKPQRELEIARRVGRIEDVGWRVRKDGSKFLANVIITQMRDRSGKEIGFVKITRDLTERQRLGQLEEAIRARDEFLSVASHELKNPMTSLYLQMQVLRRLVDMLDSDPLAKREEILRRLNHSFATSESSAKKLVSLIDEMLDITRVRLGKVVLERKPTNLDEMVRDVAARFSEEAKQVGSTIHVFASKPVLGNWDPNRLDQVITNLISNAIKYGRGSRIDIEIDTNLAHGSAVIRVTDRGMGIPPDEVPKVFDRLERATTATKISGLGLGLYIVRQIVNAHGGSVHVESELGKGSTFVVELPIALFDHQEINLSESA